jgi:hypothetical protein
VAGFVGCMGDVHHPLDITRALEVWGRGVDPLTSKPNCKPTLDAIYRAAESAK